MYNSETYKNPFWAENSGFMTGRDPLGIQNSSITLYGSLLPGMTNLTLRLRYYGLYCWLLNEYGQLDLDNEAKTLQHHYNFIRRAELTIAFLMLNIDPEVTSVIGSDFAGRNNQQLKGLGMFDISLGADKTKETIKGTVYWDYISGALGQYYAGSLIALDLIEVSNKFFIIKEKGESLARDFGNNISFHARQTLLAILETGILSVNDIDNLIEFAINNIPTDSPEWQFYNTLLINNDGQKSRTSDNRVPSNRKETIKLYIDFTETSEKDWFPEHQFDIVHGGFIEVTETAFGWYYYYLNEAIHYSIETIFWSMLIELDGKHVLIYDFISGIVASISEGLHTLGIEIKGKTVKGVIESLTEPVLPDSISTLENLTKSPKDASNALGYAFLLFLQIYVLSTERRERIKEFESKYYLNFQKGHISEFFSLFIANQFDSPFPQYLETIVKMIINDHISTAYRKMGNGESNLLKFVIEDGIIGHIQTMSPRFTNPRIRTLHNILTDMGYINPQGKATELGKELLKEIS